MTTDAILAAAKDLPLDDLRRLARELGAHKTATEARAAATAVLGRWPDAATLKLTYAAYDNGVFLEPVEVLDADGRTLCADGERIAAVCDTELTEISRAGHEPGHRPYLDVATAEVRFDGSGHAHPAVWSAPDGQDASAEAGVKVAREIVAWLRSQAAGLEAVQREPGRRPTSPVSARGARDLAATIERDWGAAAAPLTLREELDAVTLTALIAAAERSAAAPNHAFTDESLDESVHDVASEPGTTVNNGGVAAQVRYLAEQLGVNDVRLLLAHLGVTSGPAATATGSDGTGDGVIAYDRWEDFAGTLTDRARIDSDDSGVDVDRVPEPRRNEIVAAWQFGAFDQSAADADAWWASVGGPWFDRLQEALLADGYGLAA